MPFAVATLILSGLLLTAPANAQSNITSVDPATAKAGALVSASGSGIDAGNVDALYLTNGKDDIQVAISEQNEKVIKFKVPDGVKPGRWALMIHTKGPEPRLLEFSVKLTVE
jgi:hypothetical protein